MPTGSMFSRSDKHSAAGILGAAAERPGCSLLVLACDLPAVPAALLAALLEDGSCDWVVPRHGGRLEPLCALYHPKALEVLAAQVARGVMAVHRLCEATHLRIRYLEAEELAVLGEPKRLFWNVNTPADLRRVRAQTSS